MRNFTLTDSTPHLLTKQACFNWESSIAAVTGRHRWGDRAQWRERDPLSLFCPFSQPHLDRESFCVALAQAGIVHNWRPSTFKTWRKDSFHAFNYTQAHFCQSCHISMCYLFVCINNRNKSVLKSIELVLLKWIHFRKCKRSSSTILTRY